MYRILSASKDTYITDKIINNSFRATDANVGSASTLDIFKLYAESTTGSNNEPIELSRALVHFNLDPIRNLTGTFLDITHSTFKATLRLSDVYGGQTTPSNFNLIVFPLSRSFDEGVGRNVIDFTDLDSANFLTASVTSATPSVWYLSGANKQGLLGSSDIDIISSGNLSDGNGIVNLWKNVKFETGDEDLKVDVTTIVSGVLSDQIPDCGFRISFSGSEETDSVTRYVKRFASRNTSDYTKKPALIIQYDDSTHDSTGDLYFDLSGSIFLNNYARSELRNLTSGSGATEVSGDDCLHVIFKSGSSSAGTLFSKTITGSQHKIGDNSIEGIYSASFSISQFENSNLNTQVSKALSASFTVVWSSIDETVGFLTSSMNINTINRTSFKNEDKRLVVSVTNLQPAYGKNDKVRFRVFVEDVDRDIVAKKVPFYTKSQIFTKMYYRIRDEISNDIVIPFDKSNRSTICSTDTDGMYFDFYMDTLQPGRLYTIDFLISGRNNDMMFTDVAAKFKVE